MSSIINESEPAGKSGKLTSRDPREPVLRLWALKKYYPEAPSVRLYSGDLAVADNAKSFFAFTDDKTDASTWTTANTTDFVLLRKSNEPSAGWIYLSLGSDVSLKYTVYVYDNGKGEVGTLFGKYTDLEKQPEPFPEDGDDYVAQMSDGQGLWLWLYRLYGPVS